MYNSTGLPTPRGSGTSGYVQHNKFSNRKSTTTTTSSSSSSPSSEPIGPKRPSKDIMEHARKRKIELELLVLTETLTGQGRTEEEEIAVRVNEARKALEAQSSVESTARPDKF